jgi:hypothetical protein
MRGVVANASTPGAERGRRSRRAKSIAAAAPSLRLVRVSLSADGLAAALSSRRRRRSPADGHRRPWASTGVSSGDAEKAIRAARARPPRPSSSSTAGN